MRKLNLLKKMFLALVMLMTSYGLANATADSLQVYFDGTTTPPIDLSGNDNNPSDKTPILTTVSIDELGSCFDLNSSSIVRGAGFDLNITNAFTIEAYINPTACSGGVFNYSGFSINTFKVNDDSVKIKCAMRIDSDSETDVWFEPTDAYNVSVGEWHHVAFTYDGTDVNIYIDGEKAVSTNYSGHTINVEKNNMRIALGYGYTGIGGYFTGKADETKIFNKALTADQIANEALLAVAGKDVTIGAGQGIILDASASIGAIDTYYWEEVGGTYTSTKVVDTLENLALGEHKYVLKVTNSQTISSVDTMVVIAAKVYADPGADVTIKEGESVVLDGSKSVGDGLSFEWFYNGASVGTDTTYEVKALSVGTHTYTLTVTDKNSESSSNDVVVTVEAIPVKAKGYNLAIYQGFYAFLDASHSTGFDLTYDWTEYKVEDTTFIQSVGDSVFEKVEGLKEGKHMFMLKVTDGHKTSDSTYVYIDVETTTAEVKLDFEATAPGADTAFADLVNGMNYLVFDTSNGPDKTNGDRLPDNGAVPTLVAGIDGNAMQFDGANDWVNLQYAYTNKHLAARSKDYSVSLWFNAAKTNQKPPKEPAMVIFDSPAMGLMVKNDTLWASITLKDRSGTLPGATSQFKVPFTAVNIWTNVVMVFEGSVEEGKSTFKLYLNSNLLGVDTLDVADMYVDHYDWANLGATTGWASVASNDPSLTYFKEGNMGAYFPGIIDEFIITRKAFSDADVKAMYEEYVTLYNLTVTIEGNGSVSPANGSYGGYVILTATPDDGYEFAGWSGDTVSTENPLNLVMDSDKNITATFQLKTGIESEVSNGVVVYPNPSTGAIFVELDGAQESQIQVINSLGAVVRTVVASTDVVTLSLNDLDNGLYIIRVKNGDDVKVSRIQLSK